MFWYIFDVAKNVNAFWPLAIVANGIALYGLVCLMQYIRTKR